MIVVAKAPMRVSFFGGGTDYPTWYKRHGGMTISATLDKFITVTVTDEREHVSNGNQLVDTIMSQERCGYACDITTDLPWGTGVGSSSALAVALLHALDTMRGYAARGLWERLNLARRASHYERDVMGWTVGDQDQIAAAVGGANIILFNRDGRHQVDPVPNLLKQEWGRWLLFIDTDVRRKASDVAHTFVGKRESDVHIQNIADLALRGIDALVNQEWRMAGRLLDATWQAKRQLSKTVSTDSIDQLYRQAQCHGALGGKLMGAGGGGFLLLVAPPSQHDAILTACECQRISITLAQTGAHTLP